MTVVVDWAGARIGGARRLLDEFDAYLADRPDLRPAVIGRDRVLTAAWLARRECGGTPGERVVAMNNVSFARRGAHRTVLVHGPLLFLSPGELSALGRHLPPSVRLQARLVRSVLDCSDEVVVPASSMAERVLAAVPAVAAKLVVRPNPVSSLALDPAPVAAAPGDFLCPIIASSAKLMDRRLRVLTDACDLLAREGVAATILMTADPRELARDLRTRPRLRCIGRLPTAQARELMTRCAGIVFPTELESFGYPLAEARLLRTPVVALDSPHNREIAADALVGYAAEAPEPVAAALHQALRTSLPPAPTHPFDRTAYFDAFLAPASPAPR